MPTRSTRYQALDAWRGIVCLIVVLEHAAVSLWFPTTTGFANLFQRSIVGTLCLNLGAPLFFVISGYCIASSLDSTRRKGIHPTRFLARRLWRIFPPYWASVALIAGTVVLLDRWGLEWLHRTFVGLELFTPGDLNWRQWVGNITLTETWRPLTGGAATTLINRVAWALCYQEQFYLICFLALILAPKRLYEALGLITIGIVLFRLAADDIGVLPNYFGLFPDLWHEFAVGLALYWRINVARTPMARRSVEVGMLLLFLVGIYTHFVTTAAAAAFGLILIGFYRWDDAIARLKWLDPLRRCGRRSYSIYLIHLPVCTIGNAALAELGVSSFVARLLIMVPAVTAGSVAAGWLFYDLVDRRFTNLPGSKPRTTPVAAPLVEAESPSAVMPSWTG